MGAGCEVRINDKISLIYKYYINEHLIDEFAPTNSTRFIQLSENTYTWIADKYRKSFTFSLNGVKIKAKAHKKGGTIFELVFEMDDDKYAVLIGADVDFKNFYKKSTKTVVRKFLKRHYIHERGNDE